MSVIRIEKTKDYSVMSNYHLRDKNLSNKTKGLLSVMLSLPDDWDYSINGLATLSTDGKDSVMSALQELEKNGYLKRIKIVNELGQFKGFEYVIYEKPQTEKPFTEKPYTENPNTDNPPQLNTNIINTNKLNIKDNNKEIKERQFEEFWKTYPKKVNKQGSYKAFLNIPHLDKIFDKIIQDVKLKKTQWKEYQYIPYPLTYIHQRRWEEETETKQDLWWNGYDFNAELKKTQENLEKLENKIKNS